MAAEERVLVTGAAGCIGAWVVKTLAAEGVPVVGLDLDPQPRRLREIATAGELERAVLVQGDVTRPDQLGRVLDEHQITRVVHLAALQIPGCREQPLLGAHVNVVGTVAVFEAVRARLDRVPGVVYASSVALFGPGDEELAAADESGRGSQPATLYGTTKQANEHTARIYWQDWRVPSIGLRPYTVYGPARDQGVTSAPTAATAAAVRGEAYRIPFGGRTVVNFTADVARAFVQASRALDEGAWVANVPGELVEVAELVAAIEAAVPAARGLVTLDESPLPVPAELAFGMFERLCGPLALTPLARAVRLTAQHFRACDGMPGG